MTALLLLTITAQAAQAPVPTRVLALQAKTAHVQGIDTDGKTLWVTAVDRSTRKGFLYEFALADGKLLRTIELQDGDRYHPGGIQADATSLWIPVAEYKRSSSALIQRRNKQTLALEFQFKVADHIGCLAVTPTGIIGGNWDSRGFFVWNHQGQLLRKVPNPTNNGYQDLKFLGGQIVASGLLSTQPRAAIDWLEPADFTLKHRLRLTATDRKVPYTQEGMTIWDNQLLLLPEDNDSRLFYFPLPRL